MRRRLLAFLLGIVLLTCALTGCSAIGLDVETQLMPPAGSGEHEAIRTALEDYIVTNTKNGESADYTLKYPSDGQYLSAFIMMDQVQPHTLLGATAAPKTADTTKSVLAFYRRNDENALVHINLLQSDSEGNWTSVADVEGKGESVNQVEFGDLNNDGTPELLIGWSLYNTRDSRLTIYDISENLTMRTFTDTYTKLVVADITADGADDLLLLSILDVFNVVSAQMFSFQTDNVIVSGDTALDSGIVAFGDHITARLANGGHGVFLDCYKEQNAMITELICWQDRELQSPLCDQSTLLNNKTAREIPLASRDIDGDGVVEWPVTVRMPGFEETEPSKTLWYTEWRSCDMGTDIVHIEFPALLPANDGYMLRLREEWQGLPASYNAETHILTLYRSEDGGDDWLFRIGTFAIENREKLPEGYVLFEEHGNRCYAVCIAEGEDAVSLEEVRYLFDILEQEGLS